MIPKVIHYCWFGHKPMSIAEKQCIQSWIKFFPDFDIKEWNESNFDINQFDYTREAYKAKKFAFVSDVARLYALIKEGGIYFDTDITVLQNFPKTLFSHNAFAGFEMNQYVGTAVLASCPNHFFFKKILESYCKQHFDLFFKYDTTTNVQRITAMLKNNGLICNNTLQHIADITIYPQSYFCNKNYETGEFYISKDSLTVHNFSNSWSTPSFVGRLWKTLHLPNTNLCQKFADFIHKF